jgi:hypothetical protein
MMIGELVQSVLSFFHLDRGAWNAGIDARKYVRYGNLHAEVTVGNQAYSVRDWGIGGVSFETAPDARLTVGDKIQLVLKFRFLHDTITVQQPAQVVRTARRGIAAVFTPLPAATRRQFDRVLDSLHTESFLESQAA